MSSPNTFCDIDQLTIVLLKACCDSLHGTITNTVRMSWQAVSTRNLVVICMRTLILNNTISQILKVIAIALVTSILDYSNPLC